MAFLKTLLGTVALCAALLIWADYAIGPELSGSEPASGLTAAAVLASDGMTPDGSPGDDCLDRRVPVARLRGHSVISRRRGGIQDPDRPLPRILGRPTRLNGVSRAWPRQARYLPLRFTSTRVPTGTRS
jgi:hypothetical protein